MLFFFVIYNFDLIIKEMDSDIFNESHTNKSNELTSLYNNIIDTTFGVYKHNTERPNNSNTPKSLSELLQRINSNIRMNDKQSIKISKKKSSKINKKTKGGTVNVFLDTLQYTDSDIKPKETSITQDISNTQMVNEIPHNIENDIFSSTHNKIESNLTENDDRIFSKNTDLTNIDHSDVRLLNTIDTETNNEHNNNINNINRVSDQHKSKIQLPDDETKYNKPKNDKIDYIELDSDEDLLFNDDSTENISESSDDFDFELPDKIDEKNDSEKIEINVKLEDDKINDAFETQNIEESSSEDELEEIITRKQKSLKNLNNKSIEDDLFA